MQIVNISLKKKLHSN